MDELSEDSAIHCMQNEVWNIAAMAAALYQQKWNEQVDWKSGSAVVVDVVSSVNIFSSPQTQKKHPRKP